MSTSRRLFSSAATLNAVKRGPSKALGPYDLASASSEPFHFPHTKLSILKLEERRIYLHYLRLEQLQFKDLVAFRKPFVPPTARECIKVRRQHYQGEAHPADRKASIQFSVSSLPLKTDAARHKFKLLAGPRWNSVTDEVKISCELFPNPNMNEKWCSDVLDKMIKEAENTKDTMADIPLDERPTLARLKKHKQAKMVTIADFPKEWLPASPSA
ncbi:hypothetical protein MNV49_001469 [Pseudohyphozyma bogoriensis]|nr:hypothetical protein MNV49_001469 [Pseudohyphozyma bogoriensis]